MKAVILAGGSGTRLYPVTIPINKHLLPIYNKPMIYYPLSLVMLLGIKDVLFIVNPDDLESFKRLFKDGSHIGININYKIQEKPNGLAEGLILAEDFIGSENILYMLGDNVFFGHDLVKIMKEAKEDIEKNGGAYVFGYSVKDPERFGIVEFDENGNVISLEEKPKKPKSHYAVVGMYFYDNKAIEFAKKIKPSGRLKLFDYIIVGAGFSGSVIAERIANVLNKKVLIIEKRHHIGGNCFDYKDETGIIIHKYGPHLFHTDYKEVFDYLSNFTEWNIYHHKVLAFIDGKKVPIPFNFNSIEQIFPQVLANRLIEKLLKRYNYGSKIPILELLKEEDEDLKFVANFIYEKVFKNYTAKQWGKKPEEIDPEVTARVPIFIGRDDRYFNDKYQAIPKEGYTKIFERMLKHQNIKLMLNTDFKEVIKIDVESKKIYFLGQEFKGKFIFTGMIDELFDYRFGELPYRSLDLKFETLDVEYFQEVATVNYPNDYDFTRITEFKHIHPTNSPKTTILKEYPKEYVKGKDTPYYPIFTDDNQAKYNKYLEYSKEFENLILVGRLAEYKYYDMDDVVKRALEIFEKEVR